MNNDVKYMEAMTDGTVCEMSHGLTMDNDIRYEIYIKIIKQ